MPRICMSAFVMLCHVQRIYCDISKVVHWFLDKFMLSLHLRDIQLCSQNQQQAKQM